MTKNLVYLFSSLRWAYSSAGRASALQAGGHRFESYCAHHFFGPVVQLVRTLACHARGRRFEPVPGRHFFINKYGSIAQLVEQGTENPRVTGSIPVRGTIKIAVLKKFRYGYFFMELLKHFSGKFEINVKLCYNECNSQKRECFMLKGEEKV